MDRFERRPCQQRAFLALPDRLGNLDGAVSDDLSSYLPVTAGTAGRKLATISLSIGNPVPQLQQRSTSYRSGRA